ncbi:MAG: sodium:solute symporter, partial [Vulcanimicrobiaceae bacterium]
LLLGWLVGMMATTWMAISAGFTPAFALHLFGMTLVGFNALYALILNLLTVALAGAVLRTQHVADGTLPADYA